MSNETSPIFITGRFRSGSSFMWQIFDQLEGYCAWYEPLHPQLLTAIDYVEPKTDHVGVDDYWLAYRQHPTFAAEFSSEYAIQNLYMESKSEYPELESYIKQLILLSGTDIPVLQFNRVDFRINWLRAKFPQARIIHIERNPLQLYHSQRKHIPEPHKHEADYWDAYELMPWCHALYELFPFLLSHESSEHAFYRFYALYQLSRVMGKQQADVSINLDEDVFQSDEFIKKISQVVILNQAQISTIKAAKHIPQSISFSGEYVDKMSVIMTAVDMKLTAAGLIENFGQRSMMAIKIHYSDFWQSIEVSKQDVSELKIAAETRAKEITRIHQENKYYSEQLMLLPEGSIKLETQPEAIIEIEDIQPPVENNPMQLLKYNNILSNAMTQVLAINDHLKIELSALQAAKSEGDESVSDLPQPSDQ